MINIFIVGAMTAIVATFTKNKKWSILSFIILALLVASVRTGNDVINYHLGYMRTGQSLEFQIDNEFLYNFLVWLGRTLGLNFYWFKAILIFISYYILYSTMRNYTSNIGFFLINYYIYFVFIDGQQLRNFYALIILFMGIDGFIRYQSKLKYCFGVFFAAQMHFSFYCYALALLSTWKIKKKTVKILGVTLLTVIIVVFFNRDLLNNFLNLAHFFSDERGRVDYYLTIRAGLGFLPPVMMHLFACALLNLGNKWTAKSSIVHIQERIVCANKKLKITSLPLYNMAFCDFLVKLNVIMLVTVPLCMMSLVFYRLLRNVYFFNLVAFSEQLSRMPKKSKVRYLFAVLVVLCTIGWFCFDILIYYGTEETFQVVLNGVLFWQ